MIRPIIHRQLTRGDLACLVDEIARMDVSEGREADQALQAGAGGTPPGSSPPPRRLPRADLACLVDEIARMDVSEGREADQARQAGAVDTVLDSPAALEAVLGRGGAPAPLPLPPLWYIPLRAPLRPRGASRMPI